jgi:hypothetical protein
LEQVTCFFKETDEIRADLELGGLGPGLTGEHTTYSFVVQRWVTDEVEEEAEEEAWDAKYAADNAKGKSLKRWVIKKRYSHFHIFDRVLLQIIKEAKIGDESLLPVVRIPPLALRSHSSSTVCMFLVLFCQIVVFLAIAVVYTGECLPSVPRKGFVRQDEPFPC